MRNLPALVALLAGLSSPVTAGAPDFEIRHGTIAGGGGDVRAGRYQLTTSLGEPVMGTVAAGPFELTAGFPATLNAPNQIIFQNGFEPTDEQP